MNLACSSNHDKASFRLPLASEVSVAWLNCIVVRHKLWNVIGMVKVTCLTCYFRGMQQVFKKAGIEVTSSNKREIDKLIRGIVGVDYGNCPVVWKEVKKRIAENEEAFASALKEAWKKRE
jgi:hypothetical protein